MYMKKWHVTIFKFSVAFGKFTKIPPAKGLFHKKLHRPQKQNWLLITCKEIHNFDTILTQFCLIDYPIYGILHSEKSILLTHATWIMGKRRFLLKSSLVNFWFPGIFELHGVSHCVLGQRRIKIVKSLLCNSQSWNHCIFKRNNLKIISFNFFLDCTSPFQILFVANAKAAEAITTVQQRGFCLEYKQVGC